MQRPPCDEDFESALSRVLGSHVRRGGRSVGGGSISDARRHETDAGPVFVKRGARSLHEAFSAEAAGLQALAQTGTLKTPRVLAVDVWSDCAFIALEWIELKGAKRSGEAMLGEQLAALHRATQAQFGWSLDNTIGATPQQNTTEDDWVRFWRDRRLRRQLMLAARNGASGRLCDRGEALCQRLDAFFTDYRPAPSLLHGDLWGGNWGIDTNGSPVVFDPAVYFGDREADIAMTRLFGGFGPAFYAAYQSAWPLDPGADVRTTLYNLYHVLNHFNLFGGAYHAQAEAMIDELLAEVGR